MAENNNCIYCGKLIIERSREHIIQNAIGGLYESEDICCSKCNNYLSKFIDVPFVNTFNPIISRIEKLAKTNNTKSQPSCMGRAIHDGEIYNVTIKNSKVVACPELSKKLRCDASKLDFEIISYDFPIENVPFRNGIAKIAFNFALEKGICVDVLKKGLDVQEKDDKIKNISFEYPVIPFVALNPMDKYIELDTDMELYHNLILFNQSNLLWCYVDLFNTFQYYVLLSDEWDKDVSVSETYLQLLQKIDRTAPELHIRKSKHILTYAMYFNIKPCMDLEVFKKRVAEAIQKESLKKDMADVISAKLGNEYLTCEKLHQIEADEMDFYLNSLSLYFDEADRLKENTFRKVTYPGKGERNVSYPMLIKAFIEGDAIDVRYYTYAKFERLNSFLVGIDKIEASTSEE